MKHLILALAFFAQTALAETVQIGPAQGELTQASPTKAVVIMHGTAGPDSRGRQWAQALNAQGITTLVVDFKTGLFTGPQDRSRVQFQPLAEQAASLLRAKGYQQINWLGFSLGGTVGLHIMANSSSYTRAAVLYPVCRAFTNGPWTYIQPKPNTTLIVWGQLDDADEAGQCPILAKNTNNPALELANARHAFDRNEPSFSYYEPAIRSNMRLEYNAHAHKLAEERVVNWLK